MTELADLLPPLCRLAREAGAAIMRVYQGEFEVARKTDNSPVTAADTQAERIILAGLRGLTPSIPVVSEEEMSSGHVEDVSAGEFWLVDPLDGTREFVKRNGEFTVNIGLIRAGRPVLGVLYAPAIDRLFAGAPGHTILEEPGAAPRRLVCRPLPADGLVVLGSRSHRDAADFDAFLARFKVAEIRRSGSALKYGVLAAGEADLYPRFGRTMEWDTAAGHAILNACGGCLTLPDGAPLAYGKPDFANPAVVAWSTPVPWPDGRPPGP